MAFFAGSSSKKTIIVKATNMEEGIEKLSKVFEKMNQKIHNTEDVFEVSISAVLGHTREYCIKDNEYFELKTF